MNREEIIKYIQKQYGDTPQYLWLKFPKYAVFKHSNNKWYAIIMDVEMNKLGFTGRSKVDILNVKCLPAMVGSLRMNKGIVKAYHLNKENWVTIILDGSVSNDKIKELIDISYELTEE